MQHLQRAWPRAMRNPMRIGHSVLLLAVATALAIIGGCIEPDGATGPETGGSRPEAGVVKGVARDAQNRPIANAEVSVGGLLNVGPTGRGFVNTTTDAQGRYRVELPQGIVKVHAATYLSYEGQRFKVALHPTDNQRLDEDVRNGIVEDFVLKVSGLRPDYAQGTPDKSGYYGGHMLVDLAAPSNGLVPFAEGSEIVVRLTPVAALLDGTQGQTLTYRRRLTATTRNDWQEIDIPLGRYRVEASLIEAGGQQRALYVRTHTHDQDPWVTSQQPGELARTVSVLPWEVVGGDSHGRASSVTASLSVSVLRTPTN